MAIFFPFLSQTNKRQMQDGVLIPRIAALLGIDIVIVCLWIALDPLYVVDVTFEPQVFFYLFNIFLYYYFFYFTYQDM